MQKCHTCLCRTCINSCKCGECIKKTEACKRYSGFRQMDIFETLPEPHYKKAPRRSWSQYGISRDRYRKLTELMRSGEYASLALSAARRANETISEYILLSATKNISYDGLEKLWARGKIERIPYCRTDFYGIRRYFYHLFDLEVRRIGE